MKNTANTKNDQLQSIPNLFESRWSKQEVEAAITGLLDFIRGVCEKRYPSREEHNRVPKAERLELGVKSFDSIVATIDTSSLPLLQKFLFWFGHWWYYNPQIREQVYFNSNRVNEYIHREITRFLLPAMPDHVKKVVSAMEVIEVATGFGHFAILFNDKPNGIRRIVTDTELYELHGVYGYNYLDISPDGKPFTRSVSDIGGGRVFFDGTRFMAHDRFQTCAPKVAFSKGLYKVNSTQVTIVNGVLLPLIEKDDKVAHTNGAFMGKCDFSNSEAVESYRLAEETSRRLSIKEGVVHMDEKPLKSIGSFEPSRKQELDNGFTLYKLAEFNESTTC